MSTKFLEILYDFSRKELSISFFTDEQAIIYQARNPEARIFAHKPATVWIPIPTEMTHLRSSSYGFVMHFKTQADAVAWSRRVVLGRLPSTSEEGRDAYIQREWVEEDLDLFLKGRRERGLSPRRTGRGASPGPVRFGGEPWARPNADRVRYTYTEDPEWRLF